MLRVRPDWQGRRLWLYPIHIFTIPDEGLVEAEAAWHPAGQ